MDECCLCYWTLGTTIFNNSLSAERDYKCQILLCFQTNKYLTTLNKIGVPLKGVLIDLHGHNFAHAETSAFCVVFSFLIGIHSIQGWAATTRYEVTRKRGPKLFVHTLVTVHEIYWALIYNKLYISILEFGLNWTEFQNFLWVRLH